MNQRVARQIRRKINDKYGNVTGPKARRAYRELKKLYKQHYRKVRNDKTNTIP